MTSFRHILSYHDPLLSTYCDKIGLVPDLYAIPWFMTLFAHVFSLGKVYHLYDRILVGPPAMPLCVGVGVLRQMRDKLLQRDFNDVGLLREFGVMSLDSRLTNNPTVHAPVF